MSDVSDIEDLLRKAMWVKRLKFIAMCISVFSATIIGSCKSAVIIVGIARQVASTVATKDDIASLEKQYARVASDSVDHERIQDQRLAALEPKCSEAVQCCDKQTRRLDDHLTPGRMR